MSKRNIRYTWDNTTSFICFSDTDSVIATYSPYWIRLQSIHQDENDDFPILKVDTTKQYREVYDIFYRRLCEFLNDGLITNGNIKTIEDNTFDVNEQYNLAIRLYIKDKEENLISNEIRDCE